MATYRPTRKVAEVRCRSGHISFRSVYLAVGFRREAAR